VVRAKNAALSKPQWDGGHAGGKKAFGNKVQPKQKQAINQAFVAKVHGTKLQAHKSNKTSASPSLKSKKLAAAEEHARKSSGKRALTAAAG
jgi:hypothetical protein